MSCVSPPCQPLVVLARPRALLSAGSVPRGRAGSRASAPRAPDPAVLPRAASANVTDDLTYKLHILYYSDVAFEVIMKGKIAPHYTGKM